MNKKRILSSLLAVCVVFSMIFCTRTDVYANQNRKHSAKLRKNGEKRLGWQRVMKNMLVKHMSGKKVKLLYPSGNIKNLKAADLVM